MFLADSDTVSCTHITLYNRGCYLQSKVASCQLWPAPDVNLIETNFSEMLLILVVLKPEHSEWKTRPIRLTAIPCLLMPWLLASPCHQQPYYWLRSIFWSLSYHVLHKRSVKKQCQKLGNIFVRRTSYFWALRSFTMFTSPLFHIKLHSLNTVLLSGFQSSRWALKSTE